MTRALEVCLRRNGATKCLNAIRLSFSFRFAPTRFSTGVHSYTGDLLDAAFLQKRLPETADATYSFSKYTMPVVFVGSLIAPLTLTVIPEPFRDQTMPLIIGPMVATGLLLINDGKQYVYIIAAVSALLGAVLMIFSGGMMGAVLFCSAFGLTLLFAGAASLRRNLKR